MSNTIQTSDTPRTRPALTNQISLTDFKDFYWLKEELLQFCRENNLSTSGGKLEVAARIETFLSEGKIPVQNLVTSATATKRNIRQRASQKVTVPSSNQAPNNLSLQTLIGPNFKCTQVHRKFFQTVIGPKFHFSTAFQNFLKANPDKTFQDAVDYWQAEQPKKQDKNYQTNIGRQFEFNQFIRDYFSDTANKGKTHKDAVEAWKLKRAQPGDNKYEQQ